MTRKEEGVSDIRIATVGLSGSFGRIDIGNQWSSYFNTFGTLVSPTYSLGYYMYSSIGQAPYRASNTIKYSNSFGPLSAELDVRLNDSEEDTDVAEKVRGNGLGLGLTYSVTDNITIAAAFDTQDSRDDPARSEYAYDADLDAGDSVFATRDLEKEDANGDSVHTLNRGMFDGADRLGIAAKGTFGPIWVGVGWQNIEVDDEVATLTGTINSNDDGAVNTSDDIAGVVVDGSLVAGHTLTGTFDGDDINTMFLWVGGNIGDKTNWNIGYAVADDGVDAGDQVGSLALTNDATGAAVPIPSGFGAGADESIALIAGGDVADSTQVTWGVYHNMGGGLRLYYEATSIDSESKGWDGDRHLLGMRIDF